MSKELEAIKNITLNLHNVKAASTDDTNVLPKAITIEKYNSNLCSVYPIYKPISKILPKE
ncbi:MAG: hypothetical protein ABI388_03815 [Bacteroidia bacterium]